MFKKKKNYTGIPQRDCGFGSQSPQENEHHNKASHMDLFSFSSAYKSEVYTNRSVLYVIALYLKKTTTMYIT